jgi:large subunit ribosomal protein L21
MYAIINISGKQYKASEGAKVRVAKQTGDTGMTLTFDEVLMFNDGKNTEFGNPTVKGAKVSAVILDHGRDRKILVYKKKRRKGYQRKNGHRQWYTDIEIKKIEGSVSAKSSAVSKKATPVIEKSSEEEE